VGNEWRAATHIGEGIMKRIAIVTATFVAVVLGCVSVWLPDEAPSRAQSSADAAAAVQGPRFKAMYEEWSAAHEQRGGDRNVTVTLAAESSNAHMTGAEATPTGLALLNVIDGKIRVVVGALDPSAEYDVWLVDHRPIAGNSAGFDKSDSYLLAGSLARNGSQWELETDLGAKPFVDFQVDTVAVSVKGSHPTQQVALQGSPDLFQNLYTSLRTPALFAASDYVAPGAFPSRDGRPLIDSNVAMAQDTLDMVRNFGVAEDTRRQLTVVDANVVTDALVRQGAQLFIQEEFMGNGRTCETCHNFLNNITLSRLDVALRPDTDSLFVSENQQALAPRMMNGRVVFPLDNPVGPRNARPCVREDGLDVNIPPVCRSVPHLQAFSTTLRPSPPAVAPLGVPMVTPPFQAFFPGPVAMVPPAGQTGDAPSNDIIVGDAKGRVGITVDNTITLGLRGGWGGDLGIEPGINGFGNNGGIVIGAVAILLTKSGNRVPGTDFRVPTPAEINAIAAFYNTLGRQADINLSAIRLTDPIADLGRQIFLNDGTMGPMMDPSGAPLATGKCNVCHENMSSKSNVRLFNLVCAGLAQALNLDLDRDGMTARQGDADDIPICGGTQFNFETGIENNPGDVADFQSLRTFQQPLPRDGGFARVPHNPQIATMVAGRPLCKMTAGQSGFGTVVGIDFPGTNVKAGDCTEEFNTPVLVEAADSGPFFHDGSVDTIELAVAFYNSEAFIQSSGGQILNAITPPPLPQTRPDIPIRLQSSEQRAVAAALRVVNANNNVLLATDLVRAANTNANLANASRRQLLRVARAEVGDAIEDLQGAQLNGRQIPVLIDIARRIDGANARVIFNRGDLPPILQRLAQVGAGLVTPMGSSGTAATADAP
jgi:cytochrome c peroxidase